MTNTNEIYKAAMEIRSAIENKNLEGKDGSEKQLAFIKVLKAKAIKEIDHVVSEYYTDEEYDDDDTIDDMMHEMIGWRKGGLEGWLKDFNKGWSQCTIEMLKRF